MFKLKRKPNMEKNEDIQKEQVPQEEQPIENEPIKETKASDSETAADEPSQDKKKEKKSHHKGLDLLEEKVQQLGEKLAEKEDLYKRLYADFENHRKRTNIEKADLILNGGRDVIKSMLPVIDDLERAVQSMAEDDNAREGVQIILNKMLQILGQKGLKPMESKGQKFDEELHEAVTRIPAADEAQKGLVVDVVEKGYYLNEKVLRFAKVVVAF